MIHEVKEHTRLFYFVLFTSSFRRFAFYNYTAIMPSTRKKSPLSTSKKKKPTSNKPKNKKNVSKKTVPEHDVTVNNIYWSYLNNVRQVTSKSNELLELQSLNSGSEAILSTLKHLEESNHQIMVRMDRIEGNSTVSSTPIPSVVTAWRDNFTFRLSKHKSASPMKNTVRDVTPPANLINSYKWPSREELPYPGVHSTGLGDGWWRQSCRRATRVL